MGFGKELLRLRKEQKLSQDAIAVDIGVHRAMTRWVIEPALRSRDWCADFQNYLFIYINHCYHGFW